MKRAKAKPVLNIDPQRLRDTYEAAGERLAKHMAPPRAKKPPLPSAVRELLRDVVEWHRVWSIKNDAVGEDMSLHDIATRAEAIVSRARKAGRR